jgi:diadenosine tetraphosphate (Ap4A) HIT family hydrolase
VNELTLSRHSHMERTLIHDRVDAAEEGKNPAVICKMNSGWLVLCDVQNPSGWCILLASPVVTDLNSLPENRRMEFLGDMAAIGDALLRVTGAVRINYSILGNTDPALHAHIQPRFADEPEEHRKLPLWALADRLERVPFDAQRDAPLMTAIRNELFASGRCL